jgi:DNA-directed RNA polymerase subunit K/omega
MSKSMIKNKATTTMASTTVGNVNSKLLKNKSVNSVIGLEEASDVEAEAEGDEAEGDEAEASEAEAEASEAEASEAEGDELEAEAEESEVDDESEVEGDEAEASEAEASEAEASEAEASEAEADADGDDDVGNKTSKLNKKTKKTSKTKGKVNSISGIEMLKTTKKTAPITIDDDDEAGDSDAYDDDDMNELYLQKFDSELRENYIVENHAESKAHNYEEIKALSRVVRDGRGIIVDPLHKTNPILTKYEMTRILGQRAKQLDSGAKAFVKIPLNVIDGYFIAMIELEQKKMPFIIKRPLPNGGVEYWNVSDLEILI